jgi:hypothetical protein
MGLDEAIGIAAAGTACDGLRLSKRKEFYVATGLACDMAAFWKGSGDASNGGDGLVAAREAATLPFAPIAAAGPSGKRLVAGPAVRIRAMPPAGA